MRYHGFDMRRLFPLAVALAPVFLAAAGCAQSNEAPTPIPITLAPASIVDNFSGTLKVAGSNYHQFNVPQNGVVRITLTTDSYAPLTDADGNTAPNPRTDPIPALTILIGTPSATTIGLQCSPIAFDGVAQFVVTAPGTTPQLSGNALTGNYCISVSDPAAALLDSILYKVTVARPDKAP
jgi:hypothetical protein